MAAENWTAQLHIADGAASDEAAEIAYAERRDHRDRLAPLYILAEPDRPGSDQFIGELVSRIGEDYIEGEGSLTGILQRVIRDRHDELLDWNRTSLPRDQASYGVSCLIVRGRDVFLMQVGPALAYYRQGDRLLRRRPTSEEARAALGGGDLATPEFSRLPLAEGDWVLLISSEAGAAIGEEAIEALRGARAEDVLPALYPLLQPFPRVSALIVSAGAMPAEEVPEAPDAEAAPDEGIAPALWTGEAPGAEVGAPDRFEADGDFEAGDGFEAGDDFGEAAAEEGYPQRRPLREALGGILGGLGRLVRRRREDAWSEEAAEDEQALSPRPGDAAPTAPAEPAAEERGERGRDTADRDDSSDPDDPGARGGGAGAESETGDGGGGADGETPGRGAAAPPDRRVEYRLLPGAPGPADSMAARAAGWPSNPFTPLAAPLLQSGRDFDVPRFMRPLFAPTGSMVSFRRRVFRQRARKEEDVPSAGAARGWGGLALMVVIVAVLGAVIGLLLVPGLLEDSEQDRFEALLADAQRGFTAASLSEEERAGRAHLTAAQMALTQALALRPLDETALVVEENVAAALRQVDAIVRPPDLLEVRNLGGQVPPPLALSLVQVGGGALYMLDSAGARIFSTPLSGGEPTVVFEEGVTYSLLYLFDGPTAAAPVSMHWAASAAGEALTILDAERRLYRYVPGEEVRALEIPKREVLGSAEAVAVNAEGIHVLDVSGGSIWRFPQRSDATLLDPVPAIARTDLSAGLSLAAGESLFVAGSDGRIHRFQDGSNQGFPLLELDRPLLVPASLAVGERSGLLYSVDRGNSRVAVFTPAGELVAQLRDEELTDVRGVAPDEANGRLYYVTADALLTSGLPPILGS